MTTFKQKLLDFWKSLFG